MNRFAKRRPNVKRAPTSLVLLLLAVSLSSPLSAWGPNGHRIVGRIAMNHLSEEAARAIDGLIGPEGLDQVSTWPDDIRSDPSWRKAAPWHFISIDDGETLETTARAPEGDVLEAMQRFEAVLRNPQANRQSKQEALKFMVHFVGDVHQPLHVGRRADRGGNSIEVMWFSEKTNLHAVWDSHLIEHEKLSFSDFASFIDHPTQEEIRKWQGAAYADWIRESKAEREKVYKIGDGKLGFQYAFDNMPLIRHRLVQAGVRLAGLLNSIFVAKSE
jgi:hypothetical protein